MIFNCSCCDLIYFVVIRMWYSMIEIIVGISILVKRQIIKLLKFVDVNEIGVINEFNFKLVSL